MRLGVVGLLPQDFRQLSGKHLEVILDLGLTGACFHGESELLSTVTLQECQTVRQIYATVGMELVQFGIAYRECLFDPDEAIRNSVIKKIERGLQIGNELGAQYCLIRPGSLNPSGSYAPSRKNHTPETKERLIETLRTIAMVAEHIGQTIVIETYATTIMDSPETIVEIVNAVASNRIRIVMDYVNHFQSLNQVYHSVERLNHIFDVMGHVCPVGHCKDIRVGNEHAVHLYEEMPGEGELDIATAFRRWHESYPTGYMLLEHLSAKEGIDAPNHPGQKLGWSPREMATFDLYAQAARNVQRIAAEAGVPIT